MAQTIPNRKELAKEYTWNLADLFPDDDAWRAAFARMRETLAKLSDYQGRLGESAETLLAFLQLQDKLEEDGDRLLSYAFRKTDEDTRNPVYQEMSAQAHHILVESEQALAFQTPELLLQAPLPVQGLIHLHILLDEGLGIHLRLPEHFV